MLVTAAGVQLFVLTDHTDRYFAWTISPGLSAAFLGAFYFTALVLASGSARQVEWARARVGVFGVWLFVTLTLVATLSHLDKFHLSDPGLVPRGAAWLWIIIYVVEPLAVLAAIVVQLSAGSRQAAGALAAGLVPGGPRRRVARNPRGALVHLTRNWTA